MEMDTTTATLSLQEVGGCLIAGAIGSSVFYFLKGVGNSRKGQRLAGGAKAVRSNAARIGHWTAWFGVQSAIELALIDGRQIGDALNIMISFGGANALLSLFQGQGPRAVVSSGINGAAMGGAVGFAAYTLFDSPET